MGTFSFSVGRADESGRGLILSSQVTTSGAHTTSTSASFAEDASGDITLSVGDLIEAHADEAMRIRFGGNAATASTGHYIPAGEQRAYVCRETGKVSVIDVA